MDYTNIQPTGAQPSSSEQSDAKAKPAPVVTKQDIKAKPAGVGKKLYNIFFSASPQEVASDLRQNVLMPALKKGVLDLITVGASMLINGKDANSNWAGYPYNTYSGIVGTIIDYNGISTNKVQTPAATNNRPLGIFTLDTIGFTDRGKAELVKANMQQYIKQYGVVSVSDYYDFCNYDHDWQTDKWGWDNLNGIEVVPKGGVFVIALPKVRPIISA